MRYLRAYIIVSFVILVLVGQPSSVLGQAYPLASHVVINEADINPSGDDTNYPIDWVELYNPTSSAVNIGGWTIGATTGLKQVYVIPANTLIQSKQFLVFTSGPMWFPHAGAVIQLKSGSTVIDQTPPLTDYQGDANSWQRIYDGYSTGSSSDWVFRTGNPGSSNGQPPSATSSSTVTMTLTTDKTSYIFGDTVTISGKVSQFLTNPSLGYPLAVTLDVTGPEGFEKTFTVYPDVNLNYATTMKTSQVMGFPEGNYKVTASYGTITESADFSLGSAAFVPPPTTAPTTVSLWTDKPAYGVSEPITLSGNVSQVVPLTPVVYKVYDPNGEMIYQGNLYPDSQGHFTTYNPYQSHSSASGIMINSINPVYGTYSIAATYGNAKATASFAIVTRQVQTTPLLVTTDKQAYGLGETVHIRGSTSLSGLQNSGLSPSLEIVQSSAATGARGAVPQTLDIKTFVNVNSANSFTYDFAIPSDPARLGNYRAVVSTPSTKAEADFAVVQNPASYQASNQTSPFTLTTDKQIYAFGDPIIISGQVQANSIIQGVQVQISVFNSTGGQLYSKASFLSGASISPSTPLTFSAYPDSSGNYAIKQSLTPGLFTEGTYTLKAAYGNMHASVTFSVYNPLNTGGQGNIVASLDRQVYGVGDTVHLTGKLSSSAGTTAYTLTLLKPDGGIITAPLSPNNGFFSWDWTVPSQATYNTASTFTTNLKSSFNATSQTNLYGIYAITISSDFGNSQLYFQVSQNPQNQTQISPFTIETDRPTYSNNDVITISGQVVPQSNLAAQYSNSQVQIAIYTQTGQETYRYAATLNQGGQFHVTVPLQPGVWTAGSYKIYAQYLTYSTTTTFQVTNPYNISSGPLQLFITTDHDKYLPGQTVMVTGRTSYIISVDNAYLTFGLANDTIVSEGQVVSQKGITLQHATAKFDPYGSFSYNYQIPQSALPGNYTVVAQVPFGNFNAYYLVVNHLPNPVTAGSNATVVTNATQGGPPQANVTKTVPGLTMIPTTVGPTQKVKGPNTFVEKQSMISSSLVPLEIDQKNVGNQTFYPREIDGLLRVNPGDENSVTLKVVSPNGTCVIGTSPGCLVTQSTSRGGSLYTDVNLGGKSLLVGYSGSGQRIQQFTILPTNAKDSIPQGQWSIDVVKNNQVSRLYYQVTYEAN
ncbi:MAG TPA: lamin tail domain-containing protein [Candidatus Nitrosotalea sp.]|nr:lamin tail domain-containing protein [Candidatus Nitrosotalea sp.]